MKIAVDKNSINCVKKDKNKYIYLYDDEPLEELKKMSIQCINYKYCDYVDLNLTDYNINCLKKAKVGEKDYDKLPEKRNYKIGIVIPNYNYEYTLEQCLNSVLKQTYKNFEIVFVDDVSTDNSVKVAEQIYNKYLDALSWEDEPIKLKIISLKQKRYNGGARNEAYLHLSEDVDYVWYIDSDDWLINENVLEDINNKLQTNPDVLFVGISVFNGSRLDTYAIPEYRNKYEAIEGWSGSCGKVIKKELATRQECLYNEGTLKEDKNQHCKICIYMNSFELLKKPIYVWNRDNNKSVTTVRDNIMWQTSTIRHYADTKQLYLQEKDKDPMIDRYLEQRLQMCKDELIMGKDRQW